MILSLQKKKNFPGVDIDKVYNRERICKCGNTYTKFNSLINKCVKCLIAKGKQIVAKETRKVYRAQKEKLKTRRDYEKEAQQAFNSYIRGRDDGMPCISCGSHTGKRNAGHFQPTSSHPELRFVETNVHGQCERCNSYLSGNPIAYRKSLILKVGEEEVLRLEGPHEPLKLSTEDLKNLRDEYRVKLKTLKWQKE